MNDGLLLTHKFVEFIPRELEPNTIYVSIPYATAVHNCCCGCGNRVVTPISPTDWKLIFDGRSVSLEPSIGNWSFSCRSHYFIRKNRVLCSYQWSDAEIDAARRKDARRTRAFFKQQTEKAKELPPSIPKQKLRKRSLKARVKKWLGAE
jgi:hypothetical protein